jgi:uncharacterized protein (DUF433 family)
MEVAAVERAQVINRDPEVLGGIPVLVGTRVPVQTFIDYLKGGDRLDDFLT